jgi:hypothetical protein
MQAYEYKVIPAPDRGIRMRGARSGADRFAAAVAERINALAREGWEYVRADLLPCEERTGLTLKSSTVYHNLLVFRRPVAIPAAETAQDAAPLEAPHGATAAPQVTPLVFPRIRLGPAAPVAEDSPRLLTEQPHGKAPQVGPADPQNAGGTRTGLPD